MGMRKTKKTSKRMGRPPKSTKEKQSGKALVSLTPGEFAELKADARKAGLSLSAYLAHCWKQQGGKHGRS